MSAPSQGALALQVQESRRELGGLERRVLQPRSEEELRALFGQLRDAKRRGDPVRCVILGRGSSMDWCAPSLWRPGARSADETNETAETVWISTESLVAEGSTGIVEYVPGDGTLTAQAGAGLETLRAAVLEGGHRITPAGPRGGSTLGGLLASGASSIDRCGFGPTRHHVLGMRVQDATDRGPTKTGGRLVKNVTGFDLHRLHVGGRGTLGVILEASLRLVPVPEAEVLVISKPLASAAEATGAALAVRSQRGIQPRALFVADRRVHVLLAGRERQVDEEYKRLSAELDEGSRARGESAEAKAIEAAERRSAVVIGTAPSKVEHVVQRLEAAGIASLYVEPDAALVEVGPEPLRSASAAGDLDWDALLASLDPREVHVGLHRPAPELLALDAALRARALSSSGSSRGSAHRWTERLRLGFDPDGILESPDFPLPAASSR